MRPHLGDDAELLALGALDTREATLAMVHAQHCAPCGARLAAAAEIVAALDAAQPEVRAPQSLRARLHASSGRRRLPIAWLSLAAAIVVGIALTALFLFHRESQPVALDRPLAIRALVHGHFHHVALAPVTRDAPAAKVLYAQDGSWAYLVVDAPLHGARFLARGTTTTQAALAVDGDVSEAYIANARRPQRFVLIASTGEILGEASAR